ncbi:hypothetical protein Vafri_10837 [Volvox africanus]|uniref:SGNH hydrolase-type esterase domain-containing protein n=3 Tax=Volvox africanus TaxID=51714 RepID=A0A8J4BB63_9CHLO|nr:hypothetical protein Vafri_10837 [Volvox africanus]
MERILLRILAATIILSFNPPSWYAHADEVWKNEPERTRVRTELQWDWGHTYSGVAIDSQPLNRLLSSILNTYRFTLPVLQLERAISYRGSSSRLRHVVGRMLNGDNVQVGVIGGSISWGHGATKRGEKDWFSHFSKWLIDAFPRSNITARNGCVPGVPSAYMILCLEQSLNHEDVELVFVEFNLNDGTNSMLVNPQVQSMERLIRRILELPRRPAVVLLQTPSHGQAEYPLEHPKHAPGVEYKRFYETLEDAEGAVAQYYDVQMLSLRTALYRLAVFKQVEGFLWEQTFWDIHPGDQGHRIMADLAVYLIQQTAVGMLLRPFGAEDEEAFLEALPEPMYPDNKAPDAPMCIMYDAFKPMVIEARGWEYLDEGIPGKPKVGFIATTPGSRLVMRINTDRSRTGQIPDSRVSVWVQHLKSYTHMGIAQFRCISGCQCEPHVEDAHIDRRVSQLYVFRMDVTQSAQCDIEAEVLSSTKSGENKFKIAGVVIAEGSSRNYLSTLYLDGNGEFGMAEHNGNREQLVRTREGLTGDIRRLLRTIRSWYRR